MAYTFVKEGILCTALLNQNEKNSIGFYVEYFKDDFEKIIEFRTKGEEYRYFSEEELIRFLE